MQLETQLFEVVEQEGRVVSTSLLDEAKMSKRARRGIRRRTLQEPRVATKLLAGEIPTLMVHPVIDLDKGLLAYLQASRGSTEVSAQPFGQLPLVSRVPVRFSAHEASDHILQFQVPARPMVEASRDPFGQTVREWMAPYQIPPSLEGMVSATQDLWVEEIDPRCFLEQFTPAHPDVAYSLRYSLASKLIAPFIKWEAVTKESLKQVPVVVSDQLTDEPPASSFSLPEEVVDYTSLLGVGIAEQFTSIDADEAYRGSYGLVARLKRGMGRLVTAFDWTTKEVVQVEQEVMERLEVVEEEVEEVAEEIKQVWNVPMLVPRLHTVRVMAGFFGLLAIVSIPAGAVSLSRSFGSSVRDVRVQSAAALSEVQTALQGAPSGQVEAWAQASERFGQARESLLRANTLALGLAQALPQTRSQYGSAQALLTAGERTSQAAKLLTIGVSRALEDKNQLRPDERIGIFLTYLDYASPLLEEALQSLEQVEPEALPLSLRGQVAELRSMVGAGRSSFQDAKTLLVFLQTALGHDAPRTYLFVFQNHAELRPTGGFMGSLAEVTFDRGEIANIHVPGGGPYDLRSQLRARVIPPRPLQLVGGRWEFQDANWFPDFPAAADKIRWFWSQAGQPTLDGVIAINDTLLEGLLRVTGPIEMPEYGKTLSADNVVVELQKSVELEYDRTENKPKKIIGDLMPKLLSRLKAGSREDWLKLAELGLTALETKDVQVWMTRAEEEQLVERYDWNGRLKPTLGDALAIVEANIAGQKTDTSIQERVDHEVEIAEDGTITDTVTLTRVHARVKGELFKGANNVSYVRVYVPTGSRLLEATGFEAPSSSLFEIPLLEDQLDPHVARLVTPESSPVSDVDVTQEFGRTAFGGWLQLRPGETRVSRFRYTLPFTAFDLAQRTGEGQVTDAASAKRAAYMVLLTSQAGKANRDINTRVQVPAGWQMRWTNQSSEGPFELAAPWDRDRILAGLFEVGL
ncbi:DUF4012 domain-containing protein [Patescibacteria group bacterium]|nr:DUF4012 domain-containing protein [Patescibacteria group bacterium]